VFDHGQVTGRRRFGWQRHSLRKSIQHVDALAIEALHLDPIPARRHASGERADRSNGMTASDERERWQCAGWKCRVAVDRRHGELKGRSVERQLFQAGE
jgi:hypothetical protein